MTSFAPYGKPKLLDSGVSIVAKRLMKVITQEHR